MRQILQGVQRLSAREVALSVQGVRWVWNLRARSSALSVQGVRWVWNLRAHARSAAGLDSASTVVKDALGAMECGGSGICEHGRQRAMQGVRWECKECGGGSQSASTVVYALTARSAVGLESASTVVYALGARSAVGLKSAGEQHGRLRKECGGGSFCECKECGGGSICEHGRASSAVVHQSASTVVGAIGARSAAGLKSASTVVSALSARSAGGLKSASTVVYAHIARIAGCINLRARSSLCLQGVRWCINLRAQSCTLSVQGVRRGINLRARS